MQDLLDHRVALLNDVDMLHCKRIALLSVREVTGVSHVVRTFFTCFTLLFLACTAAKHMQNLIIGFSSASQRECLVLHARRRLGLNYMCAKGLTEFDLLLITLVITFTRNASYALSLVERSGPNGKAQHISLMKLSAVPFQVVWGVVSRISPAIRDKIYKVSLYTAASLILASVAMIFASKNRNHRKEECSICTADIIVDIILFNREKQLVCGVNHSKSAGLKRPHCVQATRTVAFSKSLKTKAVFRSFTS